MCKVGICQAPTCFDGVQNGNETGEDCVPPRFNPVCGSYDLDGTVINGADYMKGSWVYSQYPEFQGVDVVNIATGEKFEVDAPKPEKPGERVNPATLEVYAKNGLTFDPELRLTPEVVASKYKGISAINESCIVFNAAFFLIFTVLILIGAGLGVALYVRRARAPSK